MGAEARMQRWRIRDGCGCWRSWDGRHDWIIMCMGLEFERGTEIPAWSWRWALRLAMLVV